MSKLFPLICLAFFMTGAGRNAAATTYNLFGDFDDGYALRGSFDYRGGVFSDVDVSTHSGIGHIYTLSPFYSSSGMGESLLRFTEGQYDLVLIFDGPIDQASVVLGARGYEMSNGFRPLLSFQVSHHVSVVTPLPAALPLASSALAGLGGLGWLKRRRTSANGTAAA